MSRLRGPFLELPLGLLVAAVVLLAGEGVLRLLPVDRWERARPNVSYPVFVPGGGEFSGQYVTNPHFGKTMSFQHFPIEKPRGRKRVFVLGGSAALGWPGPIETAFTGYLQRALDGLAAGSVEVINVAAMSYGSHRVLDVLGDVLDLEPDLVVVWSGNNEYIEHNAFPRYGRTAGMRKLQRVLRHSHLYRGIRLGLVSVAPGLFARPGGPDLTDLRGAPTVRRGMLGRSPTLDAEIARNYRANLTEMARLVRASGAEGVFCTVPVNLSGWMPGNVPPLVPDPTRTQEWERDKAATFALWEGKEYVAAAAGLERLLGVTPDYAMARYLLGDSSLRLGRRAEARAAFSRARDDDPRPLRALSSFERAIREVAAGGGMHLVDLEREFSASSAEGSPGLDLFLDYVHPNEAGAKVAAAAVMERLVGLLDARLPLEQLHRAIAGDDWTQRHAYNQADGYYTLGMTLQNNGDPSGAEQAYLRALEADPNYPEPAGNLGVILENRGDLRAALVYLERAVRNDPGALHKTSLARVLLRLGEQERAREIGRAIAEQGVVDVGSYLVLGDIEAAAGRYPLAQEWYDKASAAGGVGRELQDRIGELRRKMGGDPPSPRADTRDSPPR